MMLLRVLFGFVAACLVAGLVTVLFVIPPTEAMAAPEKLSRIGGLALYAATLAAMFSAPFALIAAAIGEWQGLRSAAYYGLVGIGISLAGFMAQYAGESAGQATIINPYAAAAFIVAGLFAGLAYWLFAGRYAGGTVASTPANSVKPATVPAPQPAKASDKNPITGSVPPTGAKRA